jgi:hypothetical protein
MHIYFSCFQIKKKKINKNEIKLGDGGQLSSSDKNNFLLLFLDKSLMIFQLSLITLQNWSSKKNYKKEFD